MSDLIKREDAIKAVHNYWKKRLDTLPTKESQYGEVYADIQEMDKILEHNKTLCNFINAIPSADRPQGEWIEKNNGYDTTCECSVCHYRNFIPNYQVGSKYVCMDRYWFKRNFCPSCGARMKGADDEID